MSIYWEGTRDLDPQQYRCGYCRNLVASAKGYHAKNALYRIYISPHCNDPTYFSGGYQIPGVAPGNEVMHLPKDVEALYREVRDCVAGSAHTASVLTCRKLLMNVAVSQGAEAGQSFVSYIDYLASKGYVPPRGRAWVDHIRKKGNEANHEIRLMCPEDAMELIVFTEMLLKFIYEFPAKVPEGSKEHETE